MHRKAIVVGAASLLAETMVVGTRRGSVIGADTVVRCRSGHLFTTLWIPGLSIKAVRLGWWRLQRCPVGPHWSLVTPARAAEMTEEDRQLAAMSRDLRLP